jgi:hypothetical protein
MRVLQRSQALARHRVPLAPATEVASLQSDAASWLQTPSYSQLTADQDDCSSNEDGRTDVGLCPQALLEP